MTDDSRKRMTVRIPAPLHHDFKSMCKDEGWDMNSVIEGLIRRVLDGRARVGGSGESPRLESKVLDTTEGFV